VHLELWPQFVTASEISDDRATIAIHTNVENQSKEPRLVLIRSDVIGPDGQQAKTFTYSTNAAMAVVKEVAAGQSVEFEEHRIVQNPQRWDLDKPKLYRIETTLTFADAPSKPVDKSVASFGIREAKFEAATGFWLNGKNFKL